MKPALALGAALLASGCCGPTNDAIRARTAHDEDCTVLYAAAETQVQLEAAQSQCRDKVAP